MTFLRLQDDSLRALNYATSEATEPRTRVKGYINAWHRRLLSRPACARLLRDNERGFTSVSGQAVYGLGYPFGRLNGVRDPTNDISLLRRDLAWIRRQDPGLDIFGQPWVYAVRGWAPVAQQPSTAAAIFAIGTAAGDTDTLHWEYVLSDGSRRAGSTGLTGTTGVQLGSASTVIEITGARLATHTQASMITIRQTSGTGTVLGSFAPDQLANRHVQIQLWPTPQAALTYQVDYTREIVDLVNDFEEPLLPPDFHHLLSLGAQHDEWRRMDDDRAGAVRQDLEGELRHLNAWLWDLADTTDERRDRGWSHSRLGPWFPRGS